MLISFVRLSGIRKMTQEVLKIGTHNGTFHCDEVLACYMLKLLPLYQNSPIVRTRDPSELAKCHIVVDVGGVFDAASNRFDHHQRSFTDTFGSLVPSKPWHQIRLSSAGLVYVHFGKQVIAEVLKKLSTTDADDKLLIEVLYDRVYEQFVREIDAIDNGVEIADKRAYEITTNLSSRVAHFNPPWNDPNPDENGQFHKALEYVGAEFEAKIKYYALVWWPARSCVQEAIEKRFEVDPSGAIVKLAQQVPWKSHLFDLEKELKLSTGPSDGDSIKYVVYPDRTNGTWMIQCVPESENSFTNRLSLPAEWQGVRDEQLSRLSGIDACVFVHASGFIGGNKTLEGALAMARHALLALKKLN